MGFIRCIEEAISEVSNWKVWRCDESAPWYVIAHPNAKKKKKKDMKQ